MRRLNIILLLFAVTFISCNDNVDDNVVVSYWDNGNVKSELTASSTGCANGIIILVGRRWRQTSL